MLVCANDTGQDGAFQIRRLFRQRPARAIQDRAARPRPILSGWCPPDDARSGNAAGDRGGGASGGEHGLLRALTEAATTDSAIEATIGSIEKLDNPSAILRLVAATVRSMWEQFGDVVRVLLNTARRQGRLRELGHCYDPLPQGVRANRPASYGFGRLREELDLNQAVDVFWFNFGYSGPFTLHDESSCCFAILDLVCPKRKAVVWADSEPFRDAETKTLE
jgi:hypothetical protein